MTAILWVIGYVLGGLFACWLWGRYGGEDDPEVDAPLYLLFLTWPLVGVMVLVGGGLSFMLRWAYRVGRKAA